MIERAGARGARFAWLALCLGAGLSAPLLGACQRAPETLLVVEVGLYDQRLTGHITILRATLTTGGRAPQSKDFGGQGPISFPTTFSIALPRALAGPAELEVQGLDGRTAPARVLAHDRKTLTLVSGTTERVTLTVRCIGVCPDPAPAGDAGAPDDASPAFDARAEDSCGNGRLDPGELCDIGIDRDEVGACPPADCNDGLACTRDVRVGSACTAACTHDEIRTFTPGDGCCPADGTHQLDSDCSASCGNRSIEAGETCDTGIAAGMPGACPSSIDCQDTDPCTSGSLLSAGTCAARCVHRPITTPGLLDGCCPSGARSAADPDCAPVCGNGVLESNERCDPGVPAGRPGACPLSCPALTACQPGVLVGAGCQVRCEMAPVTAFRDNDGCCPPNGNRLLDADCAAVCGNGLLEPGESCDRAIAAGEPGACPTECVTDGCVRRTFEGTLLDCSLRCVTTIATTCVAGDACCPEGCTTSVDSDCSATCGNGVRDEGESCDTASATPLADRCPSACESADDCAPKRLVSAGTCHARCLSTTIRDPKAQDGCCPPGAHAGNDSDCAAVCGNGILEPAAETCDRAIAAGQPGACPTACPPATGCTLFRLTGAAASCDVACVAERRTACLDGDGCCPTGCNASNDSDCTPVCGNRIVEPGERCDKGISAGNPGACPRRCDDDLACTQNILLGTVEDCSRRCAFLPITACTGADGCCPAWCARADADCFPLCGNGRREAGETCDPPASCPIACPEDNDPCTTSRLSGDPARCTARCVQAPMTECRPQADGCCPSNCHDGTMAGDGLDFDPDCRQSEAAAGLRNR